jgi:hypothetical protein
MNFQELKYVKSTMIINGEQSSLSVGNSCFLLLLFITTYSIASYTSNESIIFLAETKVAKFALGMKFNL